MAELPLCPNFRDRSCERSEQRILKEDDKHWTFLCVCCQSIWVVSKPHEKARARLEVEAQRIKEANEAERRGAVKIFGRVYAGQQRA
jgi:hypothetical protein